MKNLNQESYVEYLKDEYLINSYSLIIEGEGYEFKQYNNKITKLNNTLHNTIEDFENYLNEITELNFILLNNSNNNNLNFSENNFEETSCLIYQ